MWTQAVIMGKKMTFLAQKINMMAMITMAQSSRVKDMVIKRTNRARITSTVINKAMATINKAMAIISKIMEITKAMVTIF